MADKGGESKIPPSAENTALQAGVGRRKIAKEVQRSITNGEKHSKASWQTTRLAPEAQ
jgi:hypothetical protein